MASSRSEENVNLRHFPTQGGVTVLVSPAILLDSFDYCCLGRCLAFIYGIMMLFGRCYCLIAMLLELFVFVCLMLLPCCIDD